MLFEAKNSLPFGWYSSLDYRKTPVAEAISKRNNSLLAAISKRHDARHTNKTAPKIFLLLLLLQRPTTDVTFKNVEFENSRSSRRCTALGNRRRTVGLLAMSYVSRTKRPRRLSTQRKTHRHSHKCDCCPARASGALREIELSLGNCEM